MEGRLLKQIVLSLNSYMYIVERVAPLQHSLRILTDPKRESTQNRGVRENTRIKSNADLLPVDRPTGNCC